MNDHKQEPVRFRGGGSKDLSGVLHEPQPSRGRSTILLTHCFTCSKDYRLIVRVARQLAADGLRVLRFDFTGLGDSEGEFSETTLATNVADLVAAAEWVAAQGLEVRAIIGHSLGGVAGILAARLLVEVRAVCVIASPSSSTHLLELIPGLRSDEFAKQGSMEVKIGGRNLAITKAFVDELRKHSLEESVRTLDRPFLVVHGSDDEVVSITEGEALFGFARQPKSFFSVPGANHLFSRPEDAEHAGRAIAVWLAAAIS